MANDFDAEGDSLSAPVVSGPSHGTLRSFGSGDTLTYTPSTGHTGFDSFTYRVERRHGLQQ